MLDDVPAREASLNMLDMARINRLFGGFGVLRRLLRELAPTLEQPRILDVAAGSTQTATWLQRAIPGARITSTDLRHDLLGMGDGHRVAANALSLPFQSGSFDLVVSTLFLHHLDESSLCVALREMVRVSSCGVAAVDLLRHPIAYHFLRASRPLFGWHPITVEDGRRSVQAAFSAPEMRSLLKSEEFRASVRTHHPWFRLSVSIPKNGGSARSTSV